MFKDLTGIRFKKLTVSSFLKKKATKYYWNCKCDCGNTLVVFGNHLRSGHTKSCGCIKYKHGEAKKTPEYISWTGMLSRTRDKNKDNYKYYGGRGIKVCTRWLDYRNFLSDMGRKPGKKYSIDRINVNGDYEPSNCRWATTKEQVKNRRNNA